LRRTNKTACGRGRNQNWFVVFEKAIADHKKVHTTTFLGFIFKFTLPFLLPMLIVVWWLLFKK
jgi:hypothetical protein